MFVAFLHQLKDSGVPVSIKEYLDNIKVPNYFIDQHLIKDDTLLRDIYYEISMNSIDNPIIYRITFDFLI